MADPADVRFLPFRGGELHYARAAAGSPADLRVNFLVPPGTPVASELSADASWGIAGGVYLFLGAPVRSPAPFTDAVRALLASRTWAATRLLWIADPNAPAPGWNPVGISLVEGTLAALTPFAFRNYGLVLDGGLPLRLDAATAQFAIGPGAADEVRLTTDSGATELAVVAGAVTIPLTGPAAGCLRLPARLPIGPEGAAALDALDVGCRFFYDDPTVFGTGLLTSRRYAVFDLATPAAADGAVEAVDLDVQLDPLAPLDPGRTRLAFTEPVALRSFYRTTLGSPVDLRAQDGAHLRFAPRPDGLALGDADPLYLVPHGRFSLHPPDHEKAPALLCGVGGAEYVELAASATLTFAAGHPAYASDFDPVQTKRLANPGARLTGPVSTAWAAVTADHASLGYFAQPEGAAMYGPPTAAAAALLPFFEVPAAGLPTTAERAAATMYPLVPHAGAVEELTAYERLEVQVLSQQRRQVINGLPPPPATPTPAGLLALQEDPPSQQAATPQGLVATFSADRTRWTSLQIARSGGQTFALRDITDPLKAALLTNQQFVVVSDPVAFQPYVGPDNAVVIADYRFVLDPATWARHGTVLIIKNARKPLVELVADTNTWVLGARFNRSQTSTQKRLQTILNKAEDRAHKGDPEFTPFVDLVTNPAWNGVLALNVHVPLSGLPAEIAGLAAGIDPAQFQAHHVGINQTPVPDDLTAPRNSSLFGLISYDDPRAPATVGYDFVVRSLKVRFANSLVATFRSQVVLALNEAFGTRLFGPGGDNALTLDGVFQKHGDAGTYVFSETDPTTFTAQDAVLASLRVTKAVFTTLATPAAGATAAAGAPVQTVFSFSGTLGFAALTQPVPVDLFSYDSLAYADLQLGMSFDLRTPTVRTFTFDPSHVRFDVAASHARPTGLAGHFPVTPKGMQAGAGTSRPSDLGLLPVDVDLDTAPVGTPWFALLYDLNLGSVGALAGKAGLVVSVVVAWSPGTGKPAVTVGLKLPGSTGARNALTVEGVLKITMFAVQLRFDNRSWLLTLTGIALSVFGKTLPPGASFDLFIFGDPDPAAGADSLGWYGAFKKDLPA